MNALRILILDSAPVRRLTGPLCDLIELSFRSAAIRHEVIGASDRREWWEMIAEIGADLVLVIIARHAIEKFTVSLQKSRRNARSVPVIAVLDEATPHEIAAFLKAGVTDYITTPFTAVQVVPRIIRVLPQPQQRIPNPPQAAFQTRRAMEGLVGRSPAFVAELNKIPVVARCDTGVLIQGETGTGKELCARAIHELSARIAKPFVPVNCGAIPVELAESELFGHERGAFTGACVAQKGLIAQAERGTLFLDEVVSLPLLTQTKLLRFLQEREFRPVGAPTVRKADVRVVAATNEPLERAIHDGTFRRDLFYRLNIVRILLPPLRERREDIPLLAAHFLTRCAKRIGRTVLELADDAVEKLIEYHWPGNVRELEHVIECTVIFCAGPLVRGSDISLPPAGEVASDTKRFQSAKAKAVAIFERNYIEGLLAAHRGNISSAARHAGKNRRAFWELIRKHRIEVTRFREATNGQGLPARGAAADMAVLSPVFSPATF